MEKVSYSIPYFCLEYKCVRWTFVWKAFCKGTDSIELWQLSNHCARSGFLQTSALTMQTDEHPCIWTFKLCENKTVGGSIEDSFRAQTLSHLYSATPWTVAQPGSSVHGVLQARILEWVAISSSRGSSQPRNQTRVSRISCIRRQVLYQLNHQEFTTNVHISWYLIIFKTHNVWNCST